MNTAETIRYARVQAGLTIEQIASFLGKKVSHVEKIESGEKAVKADELERLAALYGCSVQAFLKGDTKHMHFNASLKDMSTKELRETADLNRMMSNSRFVAAHLNRS